MKRQVVIVGAGPGGSTAAFYLAKMGIDVLLLDKETFPREKICGDAYVASLFPNFFDEMGISDELIEHAAAPLLEILLHDPAEEAALFKMDAGKGATGYIIPRRIGDDIICRAAQRQGAEFMERFDATELIMERGVVKGVKGYHEGKEMEIYADVVIVANGSHSMLSKQLGCFNEDPELSMFAMKAYFEGVENMVFGRSTQFYLPETIPGYKGNTMSCFSLNAKDPECRTTTLLCIVPYKTLETLDMSLEEVFEWWIHHSKQGPKYMKNAKLLSPKKGWRLVGTKYQQKNYAPGAFVIGDACSGPEGDHFYGIPPSMWGGRTAAYLIQEMYEQNDFSEAKFATFYDKMCDMLNSEYDFYETTRKIMKSDPMLPMIKEFTQFAKAQPGYPNVGYGQMTVRYLKEVHGISYPKRDSKISIGQ